MDSSNDGRMTSAICPWLGNFLLPQIWQTVVSLIDLELNRKPGACRLRLERKDVDLMLVSWKRLKFRWKVCTKKSITAPSTAAKNGFRGSRLALRFSPFLPPLPDYFPECTPTKR